MSKIFFVFCFFQFHINCNSKSSSFLLCIKHYFYLKYGMTNAFPNTYVFLIEPDKEGSIPDIDELANGIYEEISKANPVFKECVTETRYILFRKLRYISLRSMRY